MYRKTDGGVIRLSDNAVIPNEPKNKDWIEYQIWVEKGNKPEPADIKPIPIDWKKEYKKAKTDQEKISIIAQTLGLE